MKEGCNAFANFTYKNVLAENSTRVFLNDVINARKLLLTYQEIIVVQRYRK